MNRCWAFCISMAFAVLSWETLTPAADRPSGEASPHSSKANRSPRQRKSPLKWRVPTYRGLTLGTTNKRQVERIFGHPKWSGVPESPAFEASRDSELWYEYDGVDGSPGRTTIVMNRKGIVVTVILYPKKPPMPLSRAIELYGNQYIERKWDPCLTDHELNQMKDKDRPPLDTFLVYPDKGMYLQVGERGHYISMICYLLRCP